MLSNEYFKIDSIERHVWKFSIIRTKGALEDSVKYENTHTIKHLFLLLHGIQTTGENCACRSYKSWGDLEVLVRMNT